LTLYPALGHFSRKIVIRGQPGLSDPDQTYTTLVKMLLPTGLHGVVLCGLFASLMSSVDSIYNSLSTI